jgi:hypothetical protein
MAETCHFQLVPNACMYIKFYCFVIVNAVFSYPCQHHHANTLSSFHISSYIKVHSFAFQIMVSGVSHRKTHKTTSNGRSTTPAYDEQQLMECVEDYVQKTGVMKSFELGVYANMNVSQAVHGWSLVKCKPLVESLMDVSPYCMFKVLDLKHALKAVGQKFSGLVSEKLTVEAWADKMAERIMVIMNHLRRLKNSEVRLRQALKKLDQKNSEALQGLVSQVKLFSATTPVPECLALEELKDDFLDMDIMESKPVPPKKHAGVVGAASGVPTTAPTETKSGQKKVSKVDGALAKDVRFMATFAKQQSYIQYVVGGSTKKLLIAVSQQQSKDHSNIIKVMHDHFQKNPTVDKAVAQSLRAALLA